VKRLTVLVIAAALCLSAACGAVSPYAAVVNSSRLSQRGLDRELKAIRDNKEFSQSLQAQGVAIAGSARDTFDMAFVARVLTRRIFFGLIHQLVNKRHLTITKSDLTTAERDAASSFNGAPVFAKFPSSYRDEVVRTTAEISKLQGALGTGAVTPAKIQAFYEQNQALFQEACVSHILVDSEELAKSLKDQLDKGASFAELAKANSKDPGSSDKAGSLGCITPTESSNYDPDFIGGVNNATVGKVTDPVHSQFGYHLILVTARRPRSLADATAEITQRLGQDTQQAFNDLISATARKAKIRINPRYGHFDTQQLAVVPPNAPPAAAGTATTISPLSPIPGG
jgi:foldase protein PrsA